MPDRNHDVFSKMDSLLDYYVAQAADLRMRHTAIWLEVKHYTWVMSFFIGAGALAVSNVRPTSQLGFELAAALSCFGSLIAMLAFLIIRRDFRYFSRAERRLLYLERSLGVMEHEDYLDERLAAASGDRFSVSNRVFDYSKEPTTRPDFFKIRHLIQATFVFYAIYGLGQAVFIVLFVI